jgi:hypothetical protein
MLTFDHHKDVVIEYREIYSPSILTKIPTHKFGPLFSATLEGNGSKYQITDQ